MMQRLEGQPDEEFLAEVLELYYPAVDNRLVEGAAEAFEAVVWFYSCGKSDEEKASRRSKKSKQIISYEYDADEIYAAFMSQYSVDLSDGAPLHWWRFQALLGGLKEDEYISKIMGYRALDAGDYSKMSKDLRSYYHKMQREHALPKYITPEEKTLTDEINAALMHGGNISEIMDRMKHG
jgi:hypothetical protein